MRPALPAAVAVALLALTTAAAALALELAQALITLYATALEGAHHG